LPLRSSRWAAPRITFIASGARRRSIPRTVSEGGFRPKLLATLSVWFSGWNEGSLGCSEVRLFCLPCSGWR
jgi:hypothetical protein